MEKYIKKPNNNSIFEHKLIYYLYIYSHTASVGKARQHIDKTSIFLKSIKVMIKNIIIKTNLNNIIINLINIINSKLSDYIKGKQIIKEYNNIIYNKSIN
jgi:hypothetical protein